MKDATYWAWDDNVKGYYIFLPDASHTAGTRVNSVPADLNKADALLFFPAAGNDGITGLNFAGSRGYYWSGSLNSSFPSYAYFLYFDSSNVLPQSNCVRYGGFTVRPVSEVSDSGLQDSGDVIELD